MTKESKKPKPLTSLPNELNQQQWLLNGEPTSTADLIWQAMRMGDKTSLPLVELVRAARAELQENGHEVSIMPEYEPPF